MKSLFEYDVLVNDTFYRGWHILEYIEKHPDMSELDKEAIKATIMDSLLYVGLINKEEHFLDLDNLCINSCNGYKYQECPNIMGIPMEIWEKGRHSCVMISAGLPISMYVARPASYPGAYCVYDPNTAISSLFSDFTFYKVKYNSPTRKVRTDSRPFVEVEYHGELYLIDILTKRMFKSEWFRSTFDMEVIDKIAKGEFDLKRKELYKKHTEERVSIATNLSLTNVFKFTAPEFAQYNYEKEMTRKTYPEEWELYERYQQEFNSFKNGFKLF